MVVVVVVMGVLLEDEFIPPYRGMLLKYSWALLRIWKWAVAASFEIPKLGEYLSGWYMSDSLLNFDLTSLSFAPLPSPKALRESIFVTPTPSTS